MVQKIRSGQLDGAAVTAIGLAQTGVTDVLIFQLPGLFTNWAKLDLARNAMKDEFEQAVRGQGLHDPRLGRRGRGEDDDGRLRGASPGRSAGQGRASAIAGDPVGPKIYSAIGGITPQALSVAEILPNLDERSDQRAHGAAAGGRAAPVGVAHHAHQHANARPSPSARSSCLRRDCSRCRPTLRGHAARQGSRDVRLGDQSRSATSTHRPSPA